MSSNAHPSGTPAHLIVSWWFLRGLGLIYFAAFASMATQITGLIGSNGILPLQAYLVRLDAFLPEGKFWHYPTLFWLDASDTSLTLACTLGMAASLLVIANQFTRGALVACYILYLSICSAGQDFTAFQWDVLLLESGFLAILLTWHSRITLFLYRLLIARFMFMGGVVKVASGDPAWIDLSALSYHYLTQPLPSPLAYHAYFLPAWFHKACTSGVLAIELIVPVLVFLPRPFRLFAAWNFILLQASIVLTGSYNFFNLLTLLLCLLLFDDRDMLKITPSRWAEKIRQAYKPPGNIASLCAATWAGVVLLVLGINIGMAQGLGNPGASLQKLLRATRAFGVVNNYGPFAVMTKTRDEVIVEGSDDGEHWREYRFHYKPDALDKALRWTIPHQPRLDWQLWFVPLSPTPSDSWFEQFLQRLHNGSPEVAELLADNPFPNRPPRQLRALLYNYSFNPPHIRASTGDIWRRENPRFLFEIPADQH